MRVQTRSALKASLGLLASTVLGCGLAQAGTATFNLNTAPDPNQFSLTGSAEWVDNGGVNNSGHIKLTDATGQACAVLFPDFDNGLVVAAFTFECMIKCGDWYANPPADGFSVNYARANDPIIALVDGGTDPGRGATTDGWAGSQDNGGNEIDLPEEGTQTGIGIGFDTWGTGAAPVGGSNGGGDVRGISVRVEGKQLTQVAMPSVVFPDGQNHDFENDATTLITGPFSCGADPGNANVGDPSCNGGSPPATGSALKWVPLKVTVDASGVLNVFWKNQNIVKDLATPYGPGPGRIIFGASTGGAMEYAGIDDIKITTVPSEVALYSFVTVAPGLDGFVAHISDSGASVVEQASANLVLKFDGTAVTPTSWVKTGADSAITYTLPGGAVLASGSTHTVEVQAKDTRGTAITGGTKNFTTPTYVSIDASVAVTGVDKTKPGFLVRTWRVDSGQPNNNERSDQELFGELGDNTADTSGFTQAAGGHDYMIEEGVVNYWDTGGEGNFPNDATQNTPGLINGEDNNNYAVEAIGFLEFPAAGLYKLGVNSDDGFRTTIGRNPVDRFQLDGVMVGEFSGGRGVADTAYTFFIPRAGIYPVRTTYEEGGGGSAGEWFSYKSDGSRVLINDTADPDAIKSYWKGPYSDRPYIRSVKPGVGVTAKGTDAIEIVIADSATKKVVAGSVHLTVDGNAMTPSATTAAGVTTVTQNAPGNGWSAETHAVVLTYDENTSPVTTRTASFSFSVKIDPRDLDPASFLIEAEDFDYDGGKTNPMKGTAGMDVDVMPYTGGAYADLGAIEGVDYNNNDGNDSDQYRKELDENGENEVNMNDNLGGQWGSERPGWTMTVNYKIGWVEGSSWQNYTRTIPAGTYNFYAALSFDGTSPGQLNASLQKVTAGAGTANQTIQEIGVWDAPGSGGWGRNDIIPMLSPDGSKLAAKLAGGKTTLRVTLGSGDFDYFILTPDRTAKAKITSASPGDNQLDTARRDIVATIEDFGTKSVVSSIKLVVDGADVTGQASITKPADVATIKYAGLAPGKHTYTLSFTDNGTPAAQSSFTATFVAGPLPADGVFVIEAEDFNYDGGQTKAAASVMPYLGGAYDGLGAIQDVDIHENDGNDSDQYRKGEDPNANMDAVLGNRWSADRGTWKVTTNYKIGWIGGDWFNFTRTFPAGNYNVWAALSFDGRDASQLAGRLELVTSNPAQPDQTLEVLGTFDQPGSGGWGANNLVPMKDAGGEMAIVQMGGTQTVRYNGISGDFDWFVFVPAAAPPPLKPKFTSIKVNANGSITVEWTGGGTLQAGATVIGPWQDVTGATSPYTFTPSSAMLFGRIKK
jgi:hypothetical protein